MTSTREHVNAVVALLEATHITTAVSEAPAAAEPPFVVVHPSAGLEVAENLKSPVGDLVVDFQLTCVGESAEQALWCSDKARAAINRVIPTVSGRVCWPIWADEQPQPVRRDDAVNPPLFVATSRWSLRSTP